MKPPRFPPFDSLPYQSGGPVNVTYDPAQPGAMKAQPIGVAAPTVHTSGQSIPMTSLLFVIDCSGTGQVFTLPATADFYPILLQGGSSGKPASIWVANTGTVQVSLNCTGNDKFADNNGNVTINLPLMGGDTAILSILPRANGSLLYQILTG